MSIWFILFCFFFIFPTIFFCLRLTDIRDLVYVNLSSNWKCSFVLGLSMRRLSVTWSSLTVLVIVLDFHFFFNCVYFNTDPVNPPTIAVQRPVSLPPKTFRETFFLAFSLGFFFTPFIWKIPPLFCRGSEESKEGKIQIPPSPFILGCV